MSPLDPKLRVLLVDDDKNIRQTLQVSLRGLGCSVNLCASVEEAITQLRNHPFDFVLTDFKMEGQTGIDLVRFVQQLKNPPLIAVMTAFASFENAVVAIKEGAFDYIPKPFSNVQLSHLLSKVRTIVELRRENEALRDASRTLDFFAGMTSPAMRRLQEFVEKVAGTEATVLMIGESGTGKSELARLIHERSARASKPFLVVNCTNLAENLLESELFGHARGAFTGALADHVGKFEAANFGTIFLDEIGDLSLKGQSKLLRVLQERVVERVGSNKAIPVDVRVIAATNRKLEDDVKEGRFREDLYFRLNIFECNLVPLRHRKEDVPVLIQTFFRKFLALSHSDASGSIPEPVMRLLLAYSWPGNVRELSNVIERLVLLSKGRAISVEDLPSAVQMGTEIRASGTAESKVFRSLEEVEREHIEKVLAATQNQEEAANILGTTTVTLWRKRKHYGLP